MTMWRSPTGAAHRARRFAIRYEPMLAPLFESCAARRSAFVHFSWVGLEQTLSEMLYLLQLKVDEIALTSTTPPSPLE